MCFLRHPVSPPLVQKSVSVITTPSRRGSRFRAHLCVCVSKDGCVTKQFFFSLFWWKRKSRQQVQRKVRKSKNNWPRWLWAGSTSSSIGRTNKALSSKERCIRLSFFFFFKIYFFWLKFGQRKSGNVVLTRGGPISRENLTTRNQEKGKREKMTVQIEAPSSFPYIFFLSFLPRPPQNAPLLLLLLFRLSWD